MYLELFPTLVFIVLPCYIIVCAKASQVAEYISTKSTGSPSAVTGASGNGIDAHNLGLRGVDGEAYLLDKPAMPVGLLLLVLWREQQGYLLSRDLEQMKVSNVCLWVYLP